MHVSRPDRYFSDTYQEARRRFREVATATGAQISSLPLECRGPDGAALTIDIGWIGSKTPTRLLMHCGGIHGVEGFAGSAIQLRALDGLEPVGADDAIVFVHILNPFGMAWLRRFNEHNVDLSRNWLEEGAAWTGAPRVYRLVSHFLNPAVIRPWDLFYLKAILLILRYGFSPLRQAIAGGQYEDPQGLFYGGSRLEEGPAKFKAWLNDNRSTVRRLFVIDVHTGLGRWRQNSLFFPVRSVEDDALPDDIRAGLIQDFTQSEIGYEVRGGHGEVYKQLFGGVRVDCLTQEFGTYSAVKVLQTLRAENCHHHHGDRDGDFTHPSKTALRNVFCPPSREWRAGVLEDGLKVFLAARRVALSR